MKEKKPRVVFLIEILIKAARVEIFKRRLGMKGCLAVNPIGKRGGLAFFEENENEVEVQSLVQKLMKGEIEPSGSHAFMGILKQERYKNHGNY